MRRVFLQVLANTTHYQAMIKQSICIFCAINCKITLQKNYISKHQLSSQLLHACAIARSHPDPQVLVNTGLLDITCVQDSPHSSPSLKLRLSVFSLHDGKQPSFRHFVLCALLSRASILPHSWFTYCLLF